LQQFPYAAGMPVTIIFFSQPIRAFSALIGSDDLNEKLADFRKLFENCRLNNCSLEI